MKILLVEDDASISAPLIEYLTAHACIVTHAANLRDATAAVQFGYDVIVLDWMLPDGDGVTWLKQRRQAGDDTPVILLTARAEVADKVLGLELGANDYVTKPFEPRELLARLAVQTRGRQGGKPASRVLESSGIRLDLDAMEAFYEGALLEMTQMELKLLKFFLENPRRALTRDAILNEVWGLKYPTTRTVDVHVMQLRQKTNAELFETLHGIGYRFRPKV